MDDRRLDTRRLTNSQVRLYHSTFGRLDGIMNDISGGGMAIKLNTFKDLNIDSAEESMLLRPIHSDVIFPVLYLRQTESKLVVQFLE